MKKPRPPVRLLLVSAVAVALGGVLTAGGPPAGFQTAALCDQARMMGLVRAFATHPDGSPRSRYAYRTEMDTVSAALRDSLAAALGPRGSAFLWSFPPQRPPGGSWDTTTVPYRHRFSNVVGRLPGSQGGGAKFLITSHYDATGFHTAGWRGWIDPAPGADDNLSGTAAVVELARLMAADPPYPFDIEFICFDGEEMGLWGSDTLASAESAAGAKILGVFNMDMIGYNPRADSLVVMTNPSSMFLAELLTETEGRSPQAGFTLTTDVHRLFFSDHAPFWDHSYPAVLLIENISVTEHNPQYHRVTDLPETLSRGGRMMARGANIILNAVRRLGAAAGSPEFRPVALVRINGFPTDRPALPGESVRVEVVAFNVGGRMPAGESEPVRFYRVDDAGRHPLGEGVIAGPVGTGERATIAADPIDITEADGGAIRVDAEVGSGTGLRTVTAIIPVKASLTQVARHYVAPNPVRNLDRAWLCYELTREATVRLTLFDFHGDQISKAEYLYDGTLPDPGSGIEVGLNRVPIKGLLVDPDLAPGIYLYRIKVFSATGDEGEPVLGKFAVVR